MESRPPSPDQPGGPQGPPDPTRGPQAPPPGPQAPAPGVPPYQAPPAPPLAPESPPGYGGPVPPGGWQQPLAQGPHPFAGAPLSGWWRRVGAAVIDGLILTLPVVLIVILIVVVAAGSDVGAVVTGIVATLAYIVVGIFYAPVLMKREGAHNGQTWGKQAMTIRVVRDNGQQVGLGFAFLREIVVKYLLFNFVGSFLLYIPTLLDYLWPLWDDQNRCLHDMIVSTHVVRTD